MEKLVTRGDNQFTDFRPLRALDLFVATSYNSLQRCEGQGKTQIQVRQEEAGLGASYA